MRIRRIHRVTVAVHNAAEAARVFGLLFDEHAGERRTIDAFEVDAVDVPLAGTTLQFVAPLEAESPVQAFLRRKGEGFYNIALEVEDLDGAVAELRQLDVKVSEPVEAEPGIRSAFVTLAATHGLSVQLVEVARAEGAPEAGPVTREVEPRADHLPDDEPPPDRARGLIDLSVDEWSDTD